MGDINNTDPHYMKQFNKDYLTILNAKTCDEIAAVMDRMATHDSYRTWIAMNKDKLERDFNQDLFKQRIREMNCGVDVQ